jgi:hypothetical protein
MSGETIILRKLLICPTCLTTRDISRYTNPSLPPVCLDCAHGIVLDVRIDVAANPVLGDTEVRLLSKPHVNHVDVDIPKNLRSK